MNRLKNLLVFSLALISLLGCKLPASSAAQKTQAAPQVVFAEAAQTAEAERVRSTPQTPALTPAATQPSRTPTKSFILPTATLPLTVTQIATLTAIHLASETPVANQDRAEFVADVTVPDDTVLRPGEAFVKTWRLENTGDTTWTTDYQAVFVEGELMDGPYSIVLPKSVPPGQQVDISVDFMAPMQVGDYRSYWKLQNADGEKFGIGIDAAEPFWVDILVAEALATADGTQTPTAQLTLASVSLQVDNDAYVGSCPHTFIFTAQFVLNKPATVTYRLESGNDAGINLKLPPPVTRNLQAGEHSALYELTFSQSFRGWLRLHASTPQDDLASNRVNFELACQ